MKKNSAIFILFSAIFFFASVVMAKDIVHDAEYYILKAQHGKKWVAEDKKLDRKLAALRKKFGRPRT
jgi:arylsulfatase